MSAICGVVRLDGRPGSVADLAGVMTALEPLGPDGGGTWSGWAGRLGVAVGAALRRRTPEDARDAQPASDGDDLVLVGDVRLDNRSELGAADDRPDSAVVLSAYRRYGEAMLDRLCGSYAFALVDRRRGGVLLARDHMGYQPLVVHRRPDTLAFASTPLSLTALDGVERRLDTQRAAEVLALAMHSDRTFVEGVRWLPPGGAMWIGAAGIRRWQWWRPRLHDTRDHEPHEAFEQEMRTLLDISVGAMLRSSGRVGAMASGGLDSTSVAATAARLLSPDELPTYTSVPPPGWSAPSMRGWDADESPLVRDLAAMHPNMKPRFVHVEPGTSLFGRHERLWELGAEPERNPCSSLWIEAMLERAAGDGVTTLLSGEAGNFFFSASGEDCLVQLLRAGRLRTLVSESRLWGETTGRPVRAIVRRHLAASLQPPWLRRVRRRRSGAASPLERWMASTALRRDRVAALDLPGLLPQLSEGTRSNSRETALAAALSGGAHAHARLAREALTGVERRDPTGDRRLIEAALRQPDWVRRRDGIGRAIARNSMADRLPTSISQRRRRGEQLPDWLDLMSAARAELQAEVDAMAEHETSRELIDVERLRRLLAAWPDRTERATGTVERDYRFALLRAALVSRYIRWFEGGS